ncbi:MAG: hypothetical protein VB118_07295 [Oscillospiraceae bacterium]|nr:hypothetical protein [Oscillospiraceae bacterium]
MTGYYYTQKHNGISPALVLLFDDIRHPVMPVRHTRWTEYLALLPPDKEIKR